MNEKRVTLSTQRSRQTGNPVHMLGLEGVGKKLLLTSAQLNDIVQLAQGALKNDESGK